MEPSETATTLAAATLGDRVALDRLSRTVYGTLEDLAERLLSAERRGRSMEAGDLVNEAVGRLLQGAEVPDPHRTHFRGIAAHVMRQVLVDRARRRLTAKRGGGRAPVPLDLAPDPDGGGWTPDAIVAIDQAMAELAGIEALQARIVEMRVFGGLTWTEIAQETGASETTVKGRWRVARAWLRGQLASEDANG